VGWYDAVASTRRNATVSFEDGPAAGSSVRPAPLGRQTHLGRSGCSVFVTAVNIRKFVIKARRLSDLVELGTLTPQVATFLEACVVAGLNIVVACGTQAGNPRVSPRHPQRLTMPSWA
jgi:hypothetical protein